MILPRLLSVAILLAALVSGCINTPKEETKPFVWRLPEHFPTPVVPDDNPMSNAKVELGRHLFYDTRLSKDGTMSCGTCHQQQLAFTDGLVLPVGVTGDTVPRNTMSLTNIAYAPRLTWANHLLDRLEPQAMIPMFGEEPVEMGLAGLENEMLAMLKNDEAYPGRFVEAFPESTDPITVAHVVDAIAAFERSLISGASRYDRHLHGDEFALSESEHRGMDLFFSERLECFHCHGGFMFSDSVNHHGKVDSEFAYHNTGLYNVDGKGAYPETNTGLHAITGDAEDMGRFKAPTLRNIAVTAPYMHDGSIATLEEVLDHYAAGGRANLTGKSGVNVELTSEFIVGFALTEEEKRDVVAFLKTLTDDLFLTDERFSDPFATTGKTHRGGN